MAISPDILIERIKLKKQVSRWRLIALAICLGIVFLVGGNEAGRFSLNKGEHIARIKVEGIITHDPYRIKALNELAENKRVKAIVLYVDSPGGTAVGGEELYDTLLKLKKAKPLVVVMGNMATSAGCMISVPAEQIFARRATITGSIGVILQTPDISGLADKIGIKMNTVKTDSLKGEPDMFKPITPEAEAMIRSLINDFQTSFIDMVAVNRKLPRDKVKELANGRVYSGSQAINNKLVDALGGEDEAVLWLKNTHKLPDSLGLSDYSLEKPVDGLENLLNAKLSANLLIPKAFTLNGLLSLWQNNVINE